MHSPSQHQETSLIKFPCQFTIKTFGKATPAYEKAVIEIVKRYANLEENGISRRDSRHKNYLALSITIEAQSKEQLDNIYSALTQEPLVTMAL